MLKQRIVEQILHRHHGCSGNLMQFEQRHQLNFRERSGPLPDDRHVGIAVTDPPSETREPFLFQTLIPDHLHECRPIPFRVNQREVTVGALDNRPLGGIALTTQVLAEVPSHSCFPVDPPEDTISVDRGGFRFAKPPPFAGHRTQRAKDGVAHRTGAEVAAWYERRAIRVPQQISKPGVGEKRCFARHRRGPQNNRGLPFHRLKTRIAGCNQDDATWLRFLPIQSRTGEM